MDIDGYNQIWQFKVTRFKVKKKGELLREAQEVSGGHAQLKNLYLCKSVVM